MSPQPAPVSLTAAASRYARPVQWVAIGLIGLSFLLLMKTLPIGDMIQALEGWITGLGYWGPIAFAVVYIIATVTLAPGSALTLAAGAIFGLVKGTITVSIASTTGAALAFLIARYLARDKVARQARQYPKFNAVDRAIGEGGWKIVAMLRLSPAVPFNLQNYLYGLTAIRFWPCVLTSWVAMLPGTFMYVYFGYIARESAAAAAGTQGSGDVGKWVLTAVGLIATVAVTIYVTKLATRALKQQTQIEDQDSTPPEQKNDASQPPRWPWGTTATAVVAILFVSAAGYAQMNPTIIASAVTSLFGPPKVVLKETYENNDHSPGFDHSAFDAVLHEHVTDGWVDYQNLAKNTEKLDLYIASLATAPFEKLGRDDKLTLLINAYNAFTLRLILDHYPTDSIKDIPSSKRWDAKRWLLAGMTLSLTQIEHEQIRPNFAEPRIHFALVCAAVGCPALRSEAYAADRLEEQLEAQTLAAHQGDRWFQFDSKTNTVYLTKLYRWYGSDFEQKIDGTVLDYAAQYVPELKQVLNAKTSGGGLNVKYLDYDWSLNSKENAR